MPVLVPVVGLCRGKTLTQMRLDLEARVGIGRLKRRFHGKYARFDWLHKLTLSLQEPAPPLHSC